MKHFVALNEDPYAPEVLNTTGLALADFSAPRRGPCKMLTLSLDQLAEGITGRVKFAKLNVDDALEITDHYNITGVPTLLLFRDGETVGRVVGMAPPQALRKWLESELATAPTLA